MKYFELHTLYNVAKIVYHPEFKEGDLIMGSQELVVKDLSYHKIHTQQIKASGKLQDFYSPSSNLSSRLIVSTKAKTLLESYRKDNIRFYPCPVIRGKEPVEGYWITDKIIFDDDVIDFENSIFEFIDVTYLGGEVSKLENYNEKITEMKFSNAGLLWDFKKNRQNHLSRIHPKKIIIRDTCILPILNFRTIGVFYLIISEELKIELQKQKMDKGVEFKPLEIPDEEWYGPNGLRKQFYK